MNQIKTTVMAAGVIVALVFCGCKSGTEHPSGKEKNVVAIAELNPASGSNVHGQVKFYQEGHGVLVKATITGLTPGAHGFHIHEFGDCSAPDASSAGGHFNPTAMPHGGPMTEMHHVGDFGNLEADESGVAHYSRVMHGLSFEGANSVVGHAIIVHAKADDLTSQPSGNAGGRVACGVIEAK